LHQKSIPSSRGQLRCLLARDHRLKSNKKAGAKTFSVCNQSTKPHLFKITNKSRRRVTIDANTDAKVPKEWWARFKAAQEDVIDHEERMHRMLLSESPEQVAARRQTACIKIQAMHRGRIGRREAKKVHRSQLFSYTGMQSRRRFSTLYAECEEMD
jgi:hypothetical protein